jgi:aerobic carbon-monoxide dehydrogenase large subunit
MSGVMGQRILRREDSRFLLGTGNYVESVDLPGALYATFVRSPYAHARVLDVDVSAALALPGTQVFRAADVDLGPFQPPLIPGLDQRMGRPFLADEVVRFVGDIVAVVVTESRVAGVDAAELVIVDCDPLPVVIDPEQALAGDVLLFPDAGTNVCTSHPAERDESLFDDCDVVVSGRLVSQRLAACPLESRSCAATVGEDGRLTVWLSTQTPHQDRDGLAGTLGLEPTDVRVVAPDVGGGFGAKMLGVEEILVSWLARHLGRPVRWTETRSENMIAMHHGRAAVLNFTIGGSREGAVQAYRLRIVQDVGAYPRIGAVLPGFTALMASGVYAIPKIECEFTSVTTNTTPIGPFRGAGRPEATQAIERAMDLLAGEIGVDPAEVRRRNLFASDAFPLTTASGAPYDSGDYERALDLALETVGYEALREEQRLRREQGGTVALGIGVSVYVEVTNGLVEPEFGAVQITQEGEAVLRTG